MKEKEKASKKKGKNSDSDIAENGGFQFALWSSEAVIFIRHGTVQHNELQMQNFGQWGDDKVSEGAVKAVQLADGSSIPCDAVVLAMGAWASGASMPSSTNLKHRSFRACSNTIAEPSIRTEIGFSTKLIQL